MKKLLIVFTLGVAALSFFSVQAHEISRQEKEQKIKILKQKAHTIICEAVEAAVKTSNQIDINKIFADIKELFSNAANEVDISYDTRKSIQITSGQSYDKKNIAKIAADYAKEINAQNVLTLELLELAK